MEEEMEKNYKKAMEISDSVMKMARETAGLDVKVFDLAEKIEDKIREMGGFPAFPVNISINEIAAHYTPELNDPLVLKEGDLVKIDVGVHIDGYMSDTAFTVCIGKKSHPLIDASEEALNQALKLIKPGAQVWEISEVVENTLVEKGFNPVRNLCGHGLEKFNQHGHPAIPNGKNNIKTELQEGTAIAMEVFATDGIGQVKDSSPTLIYKFVQDKPVRLAEARKVLDMAKRDFFMLPFAKRWVAKKISPIKLEFALKQLEEIEAIQSFPVLKEESNGLVAQSEQTILL
ncbi:MAG: type II methionyl aminopeptidase [Candidatus Aenigmatarchaeota archaeon]